ncbi:MAG TPA: DUF3105 domain-containing protein [Thermomicrobiales bacterium]|nr:DUF3105 domain-containing protein [Thermomicrobiales bacterium]
MTFLTRVRVVAMSTAFGISIMTLSGGVVAQEVSPTPNAGADIFDPAVVEATPIPGVETFEIDSATHTTDPVDYPQEPPAGGPHDPSWQKCAVYDAPVRNENAVHSQEHGAVWITYQPDLPESDREILAELAEGQLYVLISPYPELEDPVVASAWGAQLRVDDVNDPRLQAFIDRYAGNGPEPGATCDSGVETTIGG